MSSAVRAYQRALFRKVEGSDCVIRFYTGNAAPPETPRAKRVKREHAEPALKFVGEPLPGHLLLLRPGSSYLKSQADRWTGHQPAGAKPELRIPLNRADDLPHALSALRFVYTGELDGKRDSKQLLGMRRLASFLGVDGCVEAVDTALLALAQSGLTGVKELYARRQLLPDEDGDPAASVLLPRLRAACRDQLVKHASGLLPETTLALPSGGSVNAGELLAWAFPDAPSVLSDPAARKQLLALPAAAVEALLSSAGFGTDNEASVLLLLAYWLGANPGTSADRAQRLRRCVRLCQLGSLYLHGVLPLLEWFPMSAPELRFLCQYKEAPAGPLCERLKSAGEAAGYAMSSAWYWGSARPKCRSDAGRPYRWSIPKPKLDIAHGLFWLVQNSGRARTDATFDNGAEQLVAHGLEWQPAVHTERGKDAAGAYLHCRLPAVLGVSADDASTIMGAACPGPCQLVVWRLRADGRREEACNIGFGSTHFQLGTSMGVADALALQPAPTGGASTVPARWKAYLAGDKVSGTLTWSP